MTSITVNASKTYQIHIGTGLLPTLGAEVKALGGADKVCVVSDATVWNLYGGPVTASLLGSGLEVCSFVFPAGEESKNGATFLALLNFLAQQALTRADLIVALGGGVVGDLAGFAAASYLRGIRFVQVPTTLLAAVDSSVGGKTAIDLPAGKNLAGAFCQPSLVLCDIDCLKSLPEEIFREGCAEVLKTAVLFDEELFLALARDGLLFDREWVIARCVIHKAEVVAADEFDRGQRQKLNLGHTLGHGVEALSEFRCPHGRAVAIGMALVARASVAYGFAPQGTATRILWLLQRFGLPIGTEYTAADLYRAALRDKKRSGDCVSLVIPRAVGDCVLLPMGLEELEDFIQAGL